MNSDRLPALLALAALGAFPACEGGRQSAVGTVSSIIVITTDSLWSAVGDSVMTTMEPHIYTVRSERTFDLTQVSPEDPRWTDLRRFRQVLVIGTPGDGWVEPVLSRAGASASEAPAVIRTHDVWARNQFVTALVVPPQNSAEAVLAQVPNVAQLTDSLFRAYAQERMYLSGADTVLADTLRRVSGFRILLPKVYGSVRRSPELHLFQNSTQVGGDLVRSVLIASRPGLVPVTAEAALAWRDSVARAEYRPPQLVERARLQTHTLADGAAIEVQGAWTGDDPSWPSGGPFIARMVQCPAENRTFLLDTWVYAPNPRRSKYEYLIQLQTILDSFECAAAQAAAPRAGVRYAAAP